MLQCINQLGKQYSTRLFLFFLLLLVAFFVFFFAFGKIRSWRLMVRVGAGWGTARYSIAGPRGMVVEGGQLGEDGEH